jgi:hypothetical protein
MSHEEGIEIYGYSNEVKTPHAAVRSLERYGIELSNDDLKAMSEICQGNSWRRDYQKPLGFGKHHIHVSYKDIWFNCVYSETTKIVVTILPMKANPKSKIV